MIVLSCFMNLHRRWKTWGRNYCFSLRVNSGAPIFCPGFDTNQKQSERRRLGNSARNFFFSLKKKFKEKTHVDPAFLLKMNKTTHVGLNTSTHTVEFSLNWNLYKVKYSLLPKRRKVAVACGKHEITWRVIMRKRCCGREKCGLNEANIGIFVVETLFRFEFFTTHEFLNCLYKTLSYSFDHS